MTLGAKKEFTFEVPVDAKWGGFFEPGVWAITFKDGVNRVSSSNTPRIRIVYRPETVDIMLKYVKDAKQQRSTRAECAELMLKVKPETKISFFLRTKTPDEQAEENRQLDAKIKEFEDWWKANRDTPEVRMRILDINEEYYIVDPTPDSEPKPAPSKAPGDKDPPASQAVKPRQKFKQDAKPAPDSRPAEKPKS